MTTQQNSDSGIHQRLEKMAYKKTTAFCYGCYVQAPLGKCTRCGSDDLMRELSGEGVEFGTEWVIESLLRGTLTPVNTEEAFEDYIREVFPETTKIGWLEMDTACVIQELDPISWSCELSEWLSFEEHDENMVSFDNGGTYYRTADIESYLDKNESEEKSA